MDPTVVKRIKLAWAVAWLIVTGLAFAGWGLTVAAVVAVSFAAVSFSAFVAFFLFVLMGDAPVAARVLLIVLFFAGVLIELGAMVAVLGCLFRGAGR